MKHDPFESNSGFAIGIYTALGIALVVVGVGAFFYDTVINGAYVGAYLPFFIMAPFLLFGRLLPEAYLGNLKGEIGRMYVLVWINILVYGAVITAYRFQYPTTEVERILSLRLALWYSAWFFFGSGCGPWKVIRRWKYCKATLRTLWRCVVPNPVEEITDRCVTEQRMPTPEEHVELFKYLASLAQDDTALVPADATDFLITRTCAHGERIREEVKSLRASIEYIQLSTEQALARDLQSSVQKRLALIASDITTGERHE